MRNRSGAPVYGFTLGVLAGAAAGLRFDLGLLFVAGALCVAAVSLCVSRTRAPLLVCAIFCAGFTLGLVRSELVHWRESQIHLARAAGRSVTIVGAVSADPDERATNTHVIVHAATLDGHATQGSVLAEVPRGTRVAYGETVVVNGALELPEAFASEDGRVFDYPDYLRLRGIYATLPRATLFVEHEARWSLAGTLFAAKHAFEYSIEKIFLEPTAALVEGVLFGERRGLPADIETMLVAAGLIHIVILAGYALSLVSQGVLDALSSLRPSVRYGLAALLLVFFVVMTGAAATTVRAAAMATIAMLARYLRRESVALRSLALVCAGMILYNPLHLLFDESFIISAVATFGLITLAPWCERLLSFLPERFDLRGIASSTLSVQIFALPAILYYTGTLSLWALPANLLALPALPWVMLFGFCAGALNFVHPLLALLPAMLASVFLRWILLVAQVAAQLPFGGTIVPAFPLWVMLAAYVPLVALALYSYLKDKQCA